MPQEKASKVYKLRVKVPKGMKLEMVVDHDDEMDDATADAETESGRIKVDGNYVTCCVDGAVVSPFSTVSYTGGPGGDGYV